MKRFVLRHAVVTSCAFALVVLAAACGSVGGSELVDLPDIDSGSDARSGSSSSTTSSGGSTSSSSGSASSSSGSASSSSGSASSSSGSASSSSGSTSGAPADAGAPDSSNPDSGVADSGGLPDSGGVADAGGDASDGAVCLPKETCGDGIDNDCNGQIDDGCLGTYVSALNGQDGNPGTKAAPVKTITQGIANAVALGGAQTVFVAEGRYAEKVTLVEGVSLLGGHQCGNGPACTWTQNPASFVSHIDDPDAEGVLAPKTITRATSFQGFRVNGKSGSVNGSTTGVCMTLDQGSPLVRGNTFVPGAVTGRALGVVVFGPANSPAGALIDGNTIAGGSGTTVWAGISLDRRSGGGATAVAQITKNKITGGKAPTSIGIGAGSSAAATLIQDNDILAGTSSGLGGSWGIQVSSSLTIDRNRINVDTANTGTCNAQATCGGIISQSSTTTITNNVIFGVPSARSAAVLLAEAEGPPGPVVLNGNYLDGSGAVTLVPPAGSISAAVWLRICTGAACGQNTVIGRLRNDVFVGGMNESRYGIYEEQIASRTAHPDKLDADDFYFAPATGRKDFLYHFWDGTTAQDLATAAAIGATVKTTPAPSNLLTVDPAVDGTFHLTPPSPLVNQGTLIDAPALDFDGEKRPKGAGVDIGPDESK